VQYQGHLSDGSSIQRHSAGALYPYVIAARQSGSKLEYGVVTPGGQYIWTGTYDSAVEKAFALKSAKDRNLGASRAMAHNQRQWSRYAAQRG